MVQAHERDGHSWREMGPREVGESGETIVFLHPIVGSSVYWTPQLESLSDQWRCVAWDAPGYGSTAGVGDPCAPSVTASLIDFFDVAGIDNAHVVGLSLGAMFAMHAAINNHNRFGHLVFADTSAAFGIDPHKWLDEWLADVRGGTPLTEIVDGSIDAISTAPIDPDLKAAVVSSFESVSAEDFETASRCIAFHNVRDALPGVANPTLVLVGENDGETPPEYAAEIAELMPNASLEVLSGLGHLTSIEDPATFTGLVRSFLSGASK